MKSVKDILTWYGRLITNRPFLIIALMLVFTVAVSTQMSNLKMTSMETKSLLPKGDVVVEAMTFLENEFGGTDSGLVVVQIDPKENDSDEARDVRDYRVIEYMDVLSQKISKLEGVSSAKSAADLLKSPGTGRIPKEESTIQSTLSASSQSASYISKDYSMALVRFQLTDGANQKQLLSEVNEVLEETLATPGITAEVTGSFATSVVMSEKTMPDMEKTSTYSLIGIIFVILMLFRSIKYSGISLMAILFGNIWTFGILGTFNMTMSSMSAGVLSMIMGIGIDFGIQIVARFRQELKRARYDEAMVATICGVTVPMLTTTIAALIGFRAMSLGRLTMMAEMGTIMSLGVFLCMAAAMTIVPSLLVISEKHLSSNKNKK
jgi:hydrophobe/amphiphile efflux-3 (HAE3) family protein